MDDNRLVKKVMLGIMDGQNRRGRPSREWMDDIKEWCRADGHTLSIMAQDRWEWKRVVVDALDTNAGTSPWNEEDMKLTKKQCCML